MTTSSDGGGPDRAAGSHVPDGPPAFSFLTTAYKAADTLGRTIDAVLAQTRGDWELVVVDNGNDDAVAAVVEAHRDDARVHLVRQENKGAVGGVRAAAEHATGRYLVVLNADDAVTPDFCARTGEVLDADPGVAAVTCDAVQFVDPGQQLLARTYLQTAGLAEAPEGAVRLGVADIIDGPCPYYSAPIRREVWDALGGMGHDTDAPVVHDLEFWLRAILAGHDVRLIGDRLGLFRLERGSESRPLDPEATEEFERQRELVLRRAADAAADPDAREALDRVLRRLTYQQAIRRARVAFSQGTPRRRAGTSGRPTRSARPPARAPWWSPSGWPPARCRRSTRSSAACRHASPACARATGGRAGRAGGRCDEDPGPGLAPDRVATERLRPARREPLRPPPG
ncbi:glycosyltransferase family 2 protein [Actinomycetospora sp. CA-053990]|uniref:glycosyltransferase family 2 protein n=1 Tax=Actinomycetospora sp. CA-053990 TaxID=3239891 RepID=UPI003D90AAA4